MRDIQLFLRLLAERALTARLDSGIRVLDATDFKQWLLESAEKAGQSATMEEFFRKLD
ncbi:MAG TPA: hypothetical protein VN310_10980 [Candidatus Dormibacteraeota bacterium]|jgi:hypothetical protein|nr:hypothetical protein [Candidatus Dormibacteraeota bacterium]